MPKLAIVIPFRNRDEHLKEFIPYIHNFIKDIDFDVFVVEQADDKPFNRGKLLNVGFDLARDYDYFAFHDVDMLPITADYSYPAIPIHLVKNATQFNGLAYPDYFGGVVLFNKQDFIKINGFPNDFWGYGAEDDVLLHRVKKSGLKWQRRDGGYISLSHNKNSDTPEHNLNIENWHKIQRGEKQDNTGLNNLSYHILSEEDKEGYKLIKVDLTKTKTITITAFQRPHYFQIVCESLVKNDLRGWQIIVSFENSNRFGENKAILDRVLNENDTNWRAKFHHNIPPKGVRDNPYFVLNDVFERLGSDINLYLEEDIIVAPDITKIADWFLNTKFDKEILAIKLTNEQCKDDKQDASVVYECQNEFSALGLVITKDSWFKHFKPNWYKDIVWKGEKRIGWDWAIHRGILETNPNLYTLTPAFSRANHTGREGGMHCQPAGHDETFGSVKVCENTKNLEYKVVKHPNEFDYYNLG